MVLSNKESKINKEDRLTQVTVESVKGSKTIWIKEKYAVLGTLLKFVDDDTEWEITKSYPDLTQEAKFITPGDIWDTQPIQRGNK